MFLFFFHNPTEACQGCHRYAQCFRSQCVCLKCRNEYSPVCSTRGVSYANECRLKRASCLKGVKDGNEVAKIGPCGKYLIERCEEEHKRLIHFDKRKRTSPSDLTDGYDSIQGKNKLLL